MKKLITITCLALLISGCAVSQKPHWSYTGQEGPEYWGELDEEFSICSCGKNQSPININEMVKAELEPIAFNYTQGGHEVLNNGHTVQINYSTGSSISLNGKTFELKQFHFHSPSENQIFSKSFPLEAHFVHSDEQGNLAVIAVMFEEGSSNPELEKVWMHMPQHTGDRHALNEPVSAFTLLPADKGYYQFNGSLTTPPCTEGVLWLVMQSPVKTSEEQIETFRHIIHHPNNRPVQPLNARVVLQ